MEQGLLSTFSPADDPKSIVSWLDRSSYDELYEVDALNDRCINLYHVEGKYHVPVFDSTYAGLFAYSLESMVHPDDRDTFDDLMNPAHIHERLESAEVPGLRSAQFRFRLQNGAWRWVEQYVLGGEQYGIPRGVARCYVFDIQNQKDREFGQTVGSYFEQEMQLDEKTSLIREKEFFDRARELLSTIGDEQWCIIALDVDHFRLFNDWFGREAGDLLLARVGEHLNAERIRTGGLAGYMGQDDFCIMMPYDREGVVDLQMRLSVLVEDFTTAVAFKMAFGVAFVEPNVPLLDLFDRAKIALEEARGDFKKDICLYEPSMQEKSQKEYQVLVEFKQAINDREFQVYLQPQCRISSGKVVGAEALARWFKPDGSMVMPGDFIPALEKHGFIIDLDRYIWREVCALISDWIANGQEAVPVSVNVSQADIYAIDVPEYLESLVVEYGIPRNMLKVEITESSFANSATAIEDLVQSLHDKGFTVLMDDFGSGYSSLNMLGHLNVDAIKLDAAFLHMGSTGRHKSIQIVESIIGMTKSMGLPIITEGVETQEQIDFLEGLGCRYIQGFYYYKPMPVSEATALIASGEQVDRDGLVAKGNEELQLREFLDQNIYSDAMLNSVLGAVGYYLWHDEHIDIVRFNEQFYKSVGVPDFHSRLTDIQRFTPDEDRPKLYALLERAVGDDLNGAVGTIGFYKTDGSLVHFMIHFYFLGESSEGKRFFGSARDVTEIVDSQLQMQVLADYMSSTIAFLRIAEHEGEDPGDFSSYRFDVVINGLEEVLGLSKSDLQRELRDGDFYKRLCNDNAEELTRGVFERARTGIDFTVQFDLKNARGEVVTLQLIADHVSHGRGDVSYILTMSECGEFE